MSLLFGHECIKSYNNDVVGTGVAVELSPNPEIITLIVEIKNIIIKITSFNAIAHLWSGLLFIFSPPIIKNKAPTIIWNLKQK